MAKYDVFISYSRKDSNIINAVTDRLRNSGLAVWIDEDGIESGDLFKKVITNAIEESSCLLFFSSRHSNLSKWTAKEIGIAIYENIPVIPIVLDDSKYNPEIKFDLVNRDFVDMRDTREFDKSINRIVKSIKRLTSNDAVNEIDNNAPNAEDSNNSYDAKCDNIRQQNQAKIKFIRNNEVQPSNDGKINTISHFWAKCLSYKKIHISLPVLLILLSGIFSIFLYPFVLTSYYEVRRYKKLTVPAVYDKYRTWIIAFLSLILLGVISFLIFMRYDEYKYEQRVTQEYENNTTVPTESTYSDANVYVEPETRYNNSSSTLLSGILGIKKASITIKVSGDNRIKTELTVDDALFSPTFSSRYDSFLNRKSLFICMYDEDGEFVGTLKGKLEIIDGTVVFKGEADSQDNHPAFTNGTFEFSGIPDKDLIEVIENANKTDDNL